MNRKERRIAEASGKGAADGLNQAINMAHAGQLQQAYDLCQQLLVAEPQNAQALALMGTVQLQAGNSPACIELLDHALMLDGRNATAYTHRGIAHFNLQQYDKALSDYNTAAALSPQSADIYNNRGFTFFALKRFEEALTDYDKAVALNPRYVEAYVNRGEALYNLERDSEALAAYDTALALSPHFVPAYNNRAIALMRLGRYPEALASCDRALAINPQLAEPHNTLASVLICLGKPEEALVFADRALAINPRYAEGRVNRASALHNSGQYAAALAAYDEAIAIEPRAETWWNKSLTLLLAGDYVQGWQLYEWRMLTSSKSSNRDYDKPKWLGKEPLQGKTILLHHEQGLGDAIQFCRYAPLVEALGAKVILEVPAPLVDVVSTLPTEARIITQGDAIPEFDYYCPIMSLPLALGTRVETIPATVPYLFADTEKRKAWQDKLGAKTKKRIGLVWSGGTLHKNDIARSMELRQFLPLLECDAEFHCLQKEVRQSDAETLSASAIHSHAESLNDFSDTAALIMEMDVVITVDTSVAHIAGALGKPVWVLVTHVPDFRWLLDRDDSPWYPTATLFRQPATGEWPAVVQQVKTALQALP